MIYSQWALPTILLLAQVSATSAKTIMNSQARWRRTDDLEYMKRASEAYEGDLERRSSSSGSSTLSLSVPDVETNTTTLTACTQALSNMTSVSNAGGLAACYNILDRNDDKKTFQADLRLFSLSQPSGDFENVSVSDMIVTLQYPESTSFQTLVKRTFGLELRQDSSLQQVQQFSLWGTMDVQLDLSKLNTTEIMSMMIPTMTLQTMAGQTVMSSNIGVADTAYFVTGQFADQVNSTTVTQAASTAMASAAIAASKGFVLPGTSFGIFPTGLIVCGSWFVLFMTTFGLGTLGRLQHRKIYRTRKAAASAVPRR